MKNIQQRLSPPESALSGLPHVHGPEVDLELLLEKMHRDSCIGGRIRESARVGGGLTLGHLCFALTIPVESPEWRSQC